VAIAGVGEGPHLSDVCRAGLQSERDGPTTSTWGRCRCWGIDQAGPWLFHGPWAAPAAASCVLLWKVTCECGTPLHKWHLRVRGWGPVVVVNISWWRHQHTSERDTSAVCVDAGMSPSLVTPYWVLLVRTANRLPILS
jgi:hypothetical protein